MKNLSFFALLAFSLLPLLLQAQTGKGSLLIGTTTMIGGDLQTSIFDGPAANSAGISFGTIQDPDDDDSKQNITNFNLHPKVAYFVIDGLAVGIDLNFFYSQYKEDEGDNPFFDRYTGIGAGPFVRYYFSVAEKVQPFVEAGAGIGSVKNTYGEDGGEEEEDTFDIFRYNASAGVALFVNDKLSVDFTAGLRGANFTEEYENFMGETVEDKTNVTNFGVGIGVSVFL